MKSVKLKTIAKPLLVEENHESTEGGVGPSNQKGVLGFINVVLSKILVSQNRNTNDGSKALFG